MKKTLLVVAMLSAVLVSCGGGNKKPETTPPPATAPASSAAAPVGAAPTSSAAPAAPVAESAPAPAAGPAVSGPPKPWDDMKKDERKKYMKEVVLPTMKPLFQQFDGKKFAEVNCMTCHGDGVKDGSFKMPNPDIFKLPATGAGFAALKDTKGPWLGFMMQQVKPTMAKLLGLPEYDPKTQPDGFGCLECHTSEKK